MRHEPSSYMFEPELEGAVTSEESKIFSGNCLWSLKSIIIPHHKDPRISNHSCYHGQ